MKRIILRFRRPVGAINIIQTPNFFSSPSHAVRTLPALNAFPECSTAYRSKNETLAAEGRWCIGNLRIETPLTFAGDMSRNSIASSHLRHFNRTKNVHLVIRETEASFVAQSVCPLRFSTRSQPFPRCTCFDSTPIRARSCAWTLF